MKIIAKVSSIILVVTLIISCFSFSVFAADCATIYFSKNNVEVGDKVTVSVSVNPDEPMNSLSFYLKFNSEVLNFDNGDGTLGKQGVVNINKSPVGEKSVRYNFTFTATKEGNSQFQVIDCIYVTDIFGRNTEKLFTGASATMAVKGETLSKDATLKSLKISEGKLSSSFSSSKTSYSVKVSNEVENITVNAIPKDKNAKIVSIDGADNLKIGSNNVTVIVEAQDGTQKKYTIKVTRKKEEPKETEEKDETKEDTSSEQVTAQTTGLETVVEGKIYNIMTEIPDTALFKGFRVENTDVNGYTIETAVDENSNYRIFYLSSDEEEGLIPYLYDAELDTFEKLKFIKFGDNTYILEKIPEDFSYPETLYPSNVAIGDYTVECLADTKNEPNYFKYVYCYFDGNSCLYRYDTQENTLQRYPDFEITAKQTEAENDNVLTRFGTLSTNGKVIMIALFIVVIGIFALLILLIIYLIRRSLNCSNEFIYDDDYDDEEDFESVEVENYDTEN